MLQGRSFKAGVIRLTERFVKSDPLAGRDERRLVKHLNREMGAYLDGLAAADVDRVIGTSGTILSLGALALGDAPATAGELRNQRVGVKALRRVRKRLVAAGIEERLQMPGLDPRRADLNVAGGVLLDTVLRRLGADRADALRPGAARGAGPRLHPSQRRPDPESRALSGRPPPQRGRAGRALRLLGRARPAGRPARAQHLRPDAQRPRARRTRARMARVRGAAARYRRPHQLRAPPPPLLLPDQERRPARLRAGGRSRSWRSSPAIIARATPKKSHDGYGELGGTRRRTVRALSAMRPAGRGARSQPCPGPDGHRSHSTRRGLSRPPAHARATPSWSSGPPTATSRRSNGSSTLRFASRSRDRRHKDPPPHAEQSDHAPRVSRKAVRGRGNRRLGQDDPARRCSQNGLRPPATRSSSPNGTRRRSSRRPPRPARRRTR